MINANFVIFSNSLCSKPQKTRFRFGQTTLDNIENGIKNIFHDEFNEMMKKKE